MDNVFLSEAVNDYPFAGADLNGCVNDQLGFLSMIKPFGLITENYQNGEVTHDAMFSRIKRFAKLMTEGSFTYHYSGHGTYGEDPLGVEPDGLREGLYPYDGKILWDYELIEAFALFRPKVNVLLIMDSCFSGGYSRLMMGNPLIKSRYYQTTACLRGVKDRSVTEKINGVLISGCGESQTSADAYFNGKYYGALSYFMIKTFYDGIAPSQWQPDASKKLIAARQFDQRPELLGTGDATIACFGRTKKEIAKKGCLLKFLPV